MQIVCKRCNHTWDYKGNAKRISCSHCKTSITIHQSAEAVSQQPEPVFEPVESIPVRTVSELVLSFGNAVALSNLATQNRAKKKYVVRFYGDTKEIINITARD